MRPGRGCGISARARQQLITKRRARCSRCGICSSVWPAALDCAQQPFRSNTWIAALTVIVERDGGDLARTRRLGAPRFEHAVRRQIIKQGRQKPCMRIVTKLFTALTDPAGVTAHRAGALERVQLLLEDWTHAHHRLTETETRMLGVLEDLQLTRLVTSITGLSAVGAAAILAQTGDPRRFTTARALVRHAGVAPREKTVRRIHRPHQTHRPGPPRTATRSVARSLGSPTRQPRLRRPLPTPDHEREQQTPRYQAQTVIAAAILRHLHAVITAGQARDPAIATRGTRRPGQAAAAAL
jgi:transposase